MNRTASASADHGQDEAYFANVRPEVAALLPSECAHVLEVGCGEGRFSAQIRRRQSYWGVEPSAAAERASDRLDRVLRGTWDEVADSVPDGHFDLLICNDVMEHMLNPEAFLASVCRKLAPGAMVVGSVPSVRYLPHLQELIWQADWRYREAGTLDRTHLRFFTRSSLSRLLQEQGLEVERMVGLNSIITLSPWPGRMRWWSMMVWLSLVTGKNQSDTQFLQFGFRARWPAPQS